MFIRDFLGGVYAHVRGMKFAFARKGYLPLILIPFVLTIILFSVGFYVFSLYDDSLLAYFWSAPAESSGVMAGLYVAYKYVVKVVLYVLLAGLMYFLFMVVANILASPIYDHIAGKISQSEEFATARASVTITEVGIARVILEELKKALFVIVIPLALLLIPVIGPFLSMLAAMVLLGWDFVDFSLSRDQPVFAERLKFIRANVFMMLGFGTLLLVPLVSFFLYPFAILGASLLYQNKICGTKI